MMSSAMSKNCTLCPKCEDNCIEICCKRCGKMVCALCHINEHQSENKKKKVLDDLTKEAMSNISIGRADLEKNSELLNQITMNTEMKVNEIEIKKNDVYKEIDKQFELLKKELEKRAMELKKSVDVYVANAASKIDNNVTSLVNMQKKNNYLLDLSESVLNHENQYEILKLSQFTMDNMKIASKNSIRAQSTYPEVNIELKFDCEDSLNNCIKSVEEVGNITSPSSSSSLPEKET